MRNRYKYTITDSKTNESVIVSSIKAVGEFVEMPSNVFDDPTTFAIYGSLTPPSPMGGEWIKEYKHFQISRASLNSSLLTTIQLPPTEIEIIKEVEVIKEIEIIKEIEVIKEIEIEIIKEEISFKELYGIFLKKVREYSGYKFKEPGEIMDYYNGKDDPVFKNYYMLISIRGARNANAHDYIKEDLTVEALEEIKIGKSYLNILIERLNNHK